MNTNLKAVVTGACFLICTTEVFSVIPDEGGKAGYSGKAGTDCSRCHDGGSSPTAVIEGPRYVTVGTLKNFLLRISGGQEKGGGFDVAVDTGVLSATESGTKILKSEVVQSTTRKVDSNLDVIFHYAWTAPATPGDAKMWGAGLSVNDTGKDGGDGTDTDLITIHAVKTAVNFYPLGGGFPGSGGLIPDLTGDDGEGSGSYQTHIRNGRGGAFGVLFGGLATRTTQWRGAEFVVDLMQPFFMVPFNLQGSTGQAGAGTLDFTSSQLDAFAGTTFYLQAAIKDPGAAFGVSFTDAMQMDVGL